MMRQPLQPPQRPDVQPDDETPSEVSDEDPEVPGESDQDKAAYLKKNKARVACKHRVEHRKEAMRRYDAALKDYEEELAQQRLQDEAERDHVANAQSQHTANQDREWARQGVSRNLEPEFIQVVGHNVYTTPYQNILAVENALAAKSRR